MLTDTNSIAGPEFPLLIDFLIPPQTPDYRTSRGKLACSSQDAGSESQARDRGRRRVIRHWKVRPICGLGTAHGVLLDVLSGRWGETVESFQGKAVLISHDSEEGKTQGTGFYGVKESCSELGKGQIPQSHRVLDEAGCPVEGTTSLVVAAFREPNDWRRRIATSVIENYFYAISQRKLTVIIEPDGSSELFEIDDTSLGTWFDFLETGLDGGNPEDEGTSALQEPRAFWEMSVDTEPTTETQDNDLGHCRLWIRTAEGLPSKVAIVRSTGMLITSQQSKLIRFPGYQDFAALCVFEDPEGNELLRRMENPKHDQFEPDRLPESERDRGRRALKRITDWIRGEIRKHAGPPEGGKRPCYQNWRPTCRTSNPKSRSRMLVPVAMELRNRDSVSE